MKFHDVALEQTFRGINFAICVLVLCACIVEVHFGSGQEAV